MERARLWWPWHLRGEALPWMYSGSGRNLAGGKTAGRATTATDTIKLSLLPLTVAPLLLPLTPVPLSSCLAKLFLLSLTPFLCDDCYCECHCYYHEAPDVGLWNPLQGSLQRKPLMKVGRNCCSKNWGNHYKGTRTIIRTIVYRPPVQPLKDDLLVNPTAPLSCGFTLAGGAYPD